MPAGEYLAVAIISRYSSEEVRAVDALRLLPAKSTP
jgi:hypothetical protein